MSSIWKDLLYNQSDYSQAKSYDYTENAARNLQESIWAEAFEDADSEVIFTCLRDKVRSYSFGDYLKRYIYKKAGFSVPFKEVDLKAYQDIIVTSFRDTNTPRSLHESSTTLRSAAKNWLTRDSISRESVFLLGFGLRMPVEDVSSFLTKALREQDFNFKNPQEIIFWFCIKNHYSIAKARHYLEIYETLKADDSLAPPDDRTISIRSHAVRIPEDGMISLLQQIKSLHRDYPFSQTARNEFARLLDLSKDAVRRMFADDPAPSAEISDADLEHVLYNGVPLDKRGNLLKLSASSLGRSFSSKRLSRQRIHLLTEGQVPVERSDLITLQFFLTAQNTEDMLPEERCEKFIEETNELLLRCYMGELNISNPYEAFILMCLLTEWPMAAFSEVWEISYQAWQPVL